MRRVAAAIRVRGAACSGRAIRVAVTGITASGKSTVAVELATTFGDQGTPCTRVPADGFHNPRKIRYRRGRESAEGYYRDAYDYEALTRLLLAPLGPDGTSEYAARGFDLATDLPIDEPRLRASPGEVILVDGSFLLRPEIRDQFDFKLFVHTGFDEAERRGVARDAGALGGEEAAVGLYRTRYHEAQRIYFREAQPLRHADAILINDDVESPVLFLSADVADSRRTALDGA